jgi:thiol-disulfide isomerase/thioredoxin
MKISRGVTFSTLALALLLVVGVFLINLRAAPQEEPADAAAVTTAVATEPAATTTVNGVTTAAAETTAPAVGKENRFAVPAGGVVEQLAFLERLTKPNEQFKSVEQANEYWGQAAGAMEASADKILATDAEPDQAAQAIQFKAEALRIKGMLGDKEAGRERDEFLDATLQDPRFEVKSTVGPVRLIPKLRRWDQLDAKEREQVLNNFVADVKAGGPTAGQAQLLMTLADELGDTPESGLAADAVGELLPVMSESQDPQMQEFLPILAGVHRRLQLPGNPLELAGTQIDGQPFDWEAYRGKVVLVDFWASWCPQCLAETPNILQTYHDYHDRGFEVVGINLDKDKHKAHEAMSQNGMIWPQLFETEPLTNGWTHSMAEKYSIMAIPRMILVDQQGNVVSTLARGRMLQSALQRLLGPPTAKSDAAGSESGATETPATDSQ